MIHLTIEGQTPSKKTKPTIIVNKKTGKPMLIPNKLYTAWKKGAILQLQAQSASRFTDEIQVKFTVYRWTKRRCDLINVLQSLQDILEDAGVIEDDHQIKSVDGSRLYLGVTKEQAKAKIEISLMGDPY